MQSIVELAHETPIHQFSNVATVLCRAAIAPSLLLRLAANDTIKSSNLIRGCLDAFETACVQERTINNPILLSIKNIAKDSVQSLASSSAHLSTHVISLLRQYRLMPDVFVQLLNQQTKDISMIHILLSELLRPTSESTFRRKEVVLDECCHTSHGVKYLQPCIKLQYDGCWIRNYLHMNKNITRSIAMRFTDHLMFLTKSGNRFSWGEACLMVHTIAILVVTAGDAQQEAQEALDIPSHLFASKIMDSLVQLIQMSYKTRFDDVSFMDDTLPLSSAADNFLKISWCLCIILSMTYLSPCNTDDIFLSSCQRCFSAVLQQRVSKKFIIFAMDVLNLLTFQQEEELQHLLRGTLSCQTVNWNAEIFQVICTWPKLSSLQNADLTENRLGSGESTTRVLNDPQQCQDLFYDRHVLSSCRITDIFQKLTGLLPLIMPLQVERTERTLGLNVPCPFIDHDQCENISRYHCQYLLHVLYCLIYLERSPLSPFSIDPRALSLGNTLYLLEELSYTSTIDIELSVFLFSLIAKECPDVFSNWKVSRHGFCRAKESSCWMNVNNTTLELSTLDSLNGHLKCDENIFYISRSLCCDVDTRVVKILLEFVMQKRLFVSYKSLIEDPLQLLKISLTSWKSPGVRNILISILQRLFIANAVLCMKRCPSTEVVAELLLARDVIAVECFITLIRRLKKSNETQRINSPVYDYQDVLCDQDIIINSLRWLVAQRRGLSTYFCQVSNGTVDQIAELVPECALDFVILSTQFARPEVRTSDKLKMAETSLKIASLWTHYDAEGLVRAVLNFISSLPFHTDNVRSTLHHNTLLRILSYIDSLPASIVALEEMKDEARLVQVELTGAVPRRKLSMNY